MAEVCKNCDTKIVGIYCHNCGEKILRKEDFYVSQYIGGFFSNLTNLDSKFFRTLKAFLVHPGQLSRDYFRGLREPYLSPVQFFLIVTVLFFVFTPEFDVFYVPAEWFFLNMQAENSSYVNHLAMDKMAELNLSRHELSLKYDVSVKSFFVSGYTYIGFR